MEISIRNVLGIERADLAVSPISLVTGHNASGKTSILTAIACALAGQPMPAGLPKKDAKVIVRDGADAGKIVIKTDEGQVSVGWPAAIATTDGRPPHASPIAVGLNSLLDMNAKERAQTLDRYLKVSPTKADLAQALRDSDGQFVPSGIATAPEAVEMKPLGLNPADSRETAIFRIIVRTLHEIEVNGFDGAHAQAMKTGQELKGAWRQVTAEAYGPDKARVWQPNDSSLVDDLVPSGKDALIHLRQAVDYYRHFAEIIIKNAAVTAALSAETRKLADLLPEREHAMISLKNNKTAAQEIWDALKLKQLPNYAMICPHCSGSVIIENGSLHPLSHTIDADEIDRQRAKHAKDLADARAAYDLAIDRCKDAERLVLEAKAAIRKMESAGSRAPVATEEEAEEATEALARHERALKAVQRKAEADKLHRQIVANQTLIDILSPGGIRKTKLGHVLDIFNSMLEDLCKRAGWSLVTISPDLDILFGRRPAREPFSSESQVMRVRITLQVAMAKLDGSRCILIDRADTLDKKGRNGLFKLLLSSNIPAVVAMTIGSRELAPDLRAKQAGNSYWLDSGGSHLLFTEEQKSAAEESP